MSILQIIDSEVQNLNYGLSIKNVDILTSIFRIPNPLPRASYNLNPYALNHIEDTLHDASWSQILKLHYEVIYHLQNNDFVRAYNSHINLLSNFLKIFTIQRGWVLKLLYLLNDDLIFISENADYQQSEQEIREDSEQENSKQSQAAWYINKSFSACITDNEALDKNSRKWGTYRLGSTLFKLYFKLECYHLCKNVIRAIQASRTLPDIEKFCLADKVTYRYYLGVLNFRQENYKQAAENLRYALENISYKATRNKMLVLLYLIPTNIINGKLVSPKLLRKHKVLQALYLPMVHALRTGNISKFEEFMKQRDHYLFRFGIYSSMETIRQIVLAKFIKKIYLINKQNSRLGVDMITSCTIKFSGQTDNNSTLFMLANLIDKGYIKGYLSQSHNVLVLSKSDPFPSLFIS